MLESFIGEVARTYDLHILPWKLVILPKNERRLDIKDLHIMKIALQGSRAKSLWVDVIRVKYGCVNPWNL